MNIRDRWADQGRAFITHDPTKEDTCPTDHTPRPVNPSATWIAEQCHDAYEALSEAEEAFLDAGRSACRELTGPALRALVQARARWRQATAEAVQVTNRLGDVDLSPTRLGLGRPAVDCLTPDRTGPVGDGSLAATPDGVLWVAHAGVLVDEHGHHLDPARFHAASGIILTRADRWTIVEEALASVFVQGAMVQDSRGDSVQVCAPSSWDAIADGDPSCWRAGWYFPNGIVHIKGARHHGWMHSEFLNRG